MTYGDIDVFGTPADGLVRQLRARTPVVMDDWGHSATSHELVLAFWRSVVPEDDDDPNGRYFEGVLVARPGYYD